MGQLLVGPIRLSAIALDPRVWWPPFPLLLLIVVATLSASVVWAIRTKAPTRDLVIQVLALSAYLLTAVVAIASEGGGRVPAYAHRLPSLLTQGILLAQLVRIWKPYVLLCPIASLRSGIVMSSSDFWMKGT